MSNLYLKHHGILGMKWGIRRYQNKDGTLTDIGKRRKEQIHNAINKPIRRYKNEDGTLTDIGKRRKEQAHRAIKQGKEGKSSAGEKVFRNSRDAVNEAAHIVDKFGSKKYDYSNMSDAELRTKLNRLRMETEYSKITGDDTKKGKKVVLDILDVAGSGLAIAASAASIATAIHFIKNG